MLFEIQEMRQEFLRLAQNFLEKGEKPTTISEVMAESIISFVQKFPEQKKILIIESIYAHFAKILGRDPTVLLPEREKSGK